jgi:hypothetical protein
MVSLDTNDFNFFANLDDTGFNAAGHNRTTTRDREHVFDWHQEWLVNRTLWLWDIAVNSAISCQDRFFTDVASRPSSAAKAEPLVMGISSPGKS